MTEEQEAKLWRQFQEALDRSDNLYTIEDIKALHQSGDIQWWASEDLLGHMLTQVAEFPQKKVLYLFLCFGDMKGTKNAEEIYAKVTEFAKRQGCGSIYMNGRPGWAKHLEKKGWTSTEYVYRLNLGE